MALEPEQFLERAVSAGSLDAEKGRAALLVYSRLSAMGATFSFGEFLVERGMLTRMAVETFEADSGDEVSTVDTLGDFELLELLGEGENGVVYRAMQKSLTREVAVKILNTELAREDAAVERFLIEARAVAKLNHPNVVQGISAGTEAGLHYFAMELLDGGSVRHLQEAEGGRLSERRALEIIRQSAQGLEAAHAAGILHRDIKPDNILLNRAGIAKLTDLGIAQVAQGHEGTEGGIFWGSPPYVSPEVITGSALNDPRSDIYSLGATLFEMLIGSPPFMADEPDEILRMHLQEEPLDVKQLRPELHPRTAALVRLMLAKNPDERARGAAIVSEAANKIIQALDAQPQPQVTANPSPSPLPKKPIVPVRRPVSGTLKKPLRPLRPASGATKKPLPSRPLLSKGKPPARPSIRPGNRPRPK